MTKSTFKKTLIYFVCFFIYSALIQFFTGFHFHQNADSILLSIMSYTKPTLFHWESSYILMTLPCLFSFAHNPEMNLFLISSAQLLIILFLPYLAAKTLLLDNSMLFWAIGLIILATLNVFFWFELCYLAYALSFFTGTISLLLLSITLNSKSNLLKHVLLGLSGIMAVLAYKTAEPVIVIIILWAVYITLHNNIVVLYSAIKSFDTRTIITNLKIIIIWFLYFLLAYILFAILQKCLFEVQDKRIWQLNLTGIFNAFWLLFRNFLEFYDSYYLFTSTTIIITVLGYCFLAVKHKFKVISTSLYLFIIPAIIIAFSMASSEWVRMNQCFPRYIFLPIYLLVFNCAFLLCTLLKIIKLRSIYLTLVSFFLILCGLIIILLRFSPALTPKSLKDRISDHFGFYNYYNSGIAYIGAIGNYWDVWPMVWIENADGNRNFVGITYKSEAIEKLIRDRLSKFRSIKLVCFDKDIDLPRLCDYWFPNCIIKKNISGDKSFLEVTLNVSSPK